MNILTRSPRSPFCFGQTIKNSNPVTNSPIRVVATRSFANNYRVFSSKSLQSPTQEMIKAVYPVDKRKFNPSWIVIPALAGFVIGSTYSEEIERQWIDFATEHSLSFFLKFLPKKHLEERLSSYLCSGKFEQAKFLLNFVSEDYLEEQFFSHLCWGRFEQAEFFIDFISKKRLEEQLRLDVCFGRFEQAKFLINSGEVDINNEEVDINNEENWDRPQQTSTLLKEFYPTTEKDLNQYMDFITFVLDHGYQHLNHPINKDLNLITHVYNRSIFEKDITLRRKFISFLLEKGVTPFIDSPFDSFLLETALVSFKSPLNWAVFVGDGPFFIETCIRFNIDIRAQLDGNHGYQLFNLAIISGHASDIIDLLKLGIKLGNEPGKDKDQIFKDLESWKFQISGGEKEIAQIKEAITNLN